MYSYRRYLKYILIVLLACFLNCPGNAAAQESPLVTDKVIAILSRVSPKISNELARRDFRLGAPIFIRIFKLPGELEVWMLKNGRYHKFKTYPICDYSGYPGPKIQEGDWQSPEGFYRVSPDQMNPRSSYHLSFNIGYPNEYDKSMNRTGSHIMVHGSCSSKGCFAMNDYRMEEIYTLAHAAMTHGQEAFDVHIFPFPLTEENLNKYRHSPWIMFWKNLKEGYDAFENNHQIPFIQAKKGKYIVDPLPVKLALSKDTNVTRK